MVNRVSIGSPIWCRAIIGTSFWKYHRTKAAILIGGGGGGGIILLWGIIYNFVFHHWFLSDIVCTHTAGRLVIRIYSIEFDHFQWLVLYCGTRERHGVSNHTTATFVQQFVQANITWIPSRRDNDAENVSTSKRSHVWSWMRIWVGYQIIDKNRDVSVKSQVEMWWAGVNHSKQSNMMSVSEWVIKFNGLLGTADIGVHITWCQEVDGLKNGTMEWQRIQVRQSNVMLVEWGRSSNRTCVFFQREIATAEFSWEIEVISIFQIERTRNCQCYLHTGVTEQSEGCPHAGEVTLKNTGE